MGHLAYSPSSHGSGWTSWPIYPRDGGLREFARGKAIPTPVTALRAARRATSAARRVATRLMKKPIQRSKRLQRRRNLEAFRCKRLSSPSWLSVLAACTVLRLAKLSADHGTQSGYGPAVVEQLAVLRAARKRGERTIATNVSPFPNLRARPAHAGATGGAELCRSARPSGTVARSACG